MRTAASLSAGFLLAYMQAYAQPLETPLLFVSHDTTRRDHLSTYGYGRPTSPALDRLAAKSLVFENAFAQQTRTNPSHASMFTGLYPHEHGAVSNSHALPAEHVTLAERLRDRGYECGAFVSGYTMTRGFGLEQGFDPYDDEIPKSGRRIGEKTVDRALGWLRARGDRPWFLFVHLFDAHGPYRPPERYTEMFATRSPGAPLRNIPKYQQRQDASGRPIRTLAPYEDAYDASIRYADDQLGRLIDAIDLDRTIVVVVADHGETLDERHVPLSHGASVFDEQTRIPLVVHVPGQAPRRVQPLVETVDLLPMLLDGSFTPPVKTRVFASSAAKSRAHADRSYRLDERAQIHSVRTERWKLIRYPGPGTTYTELYDLREDPEERRDVATSFPGERHELDQVLTKWLSTARPPIPPAEGVDPDRLRGLGYID